MSVSSYSVLRDHSAFVLKVKQSRMQHRSLFPNQHAVKNQKNAVSVTLSVRILNLASHIQSHQKKNIL